MPYRSNDDLPPGIRARLPIHARDIFRASFNHAWVSLAGDPDREAIAHRIAWAAVKKRYRKTGDVWSVRSTPASAD